MQTVNILGEEYTIEYRLESDDPSLRDIGGYCDITIRKIVIAKMEQHPLHTCEDMEEFARRVLRHEIVHAFLTESGLDDQSFAINEEIVDWIALQLPKMVKTMKEAKAL